MSKWAIRDIKHAKTFHFNSYDEMKDWINKTDQKPGHTTSAGPDQDELNPKNSNSNN
jgi:hypothetical protein